MTTATPDHAKAQAEQRSMAERGDVLQRMRIRALDLNRDEHGTRSVYCDDDPLGSHKWLTPTWCKTVRYDGIDTFPRFGADGWSEPFVTNTTGLETLRAKTVPADRLPELIANAKIARDKHDSAVAEELEKRAGEAVQWSEADRIDERKRVHMKWVASPLNYLQAHIKGTKAQPFQPYCEIEILGPAVPVASPETQDAERIAKATAQGASAAPADMAAIIATAVEAGVKAGLAAAQQSPRSNRKDV